MREDGSCGRVEELEEVKRSWEGVLVKVWEFAKELKRNAGEEERIERRQEKKGGWKRAIGKGPRAELRRQMGGVAAKLEVEN